MVQYGMVWCGMVWYGMVQYGMVWYSIVCFNTTDACKTYDTVAVHNLLPQDEPSGSEHVEDIEKLKIKILI
jgi:hypothetical protein